jgi:hypothetical protein
MQLVKCKEIDCTNIKEDEIKLETSEIVKNLLKQKGKKNEGDKIILPLFMRILHNFGESSEKFCKSVLKKVFSSFISEMTL